VKNANTVIVSNFVARQSKKKSNLFSDLDFECNEGIHLKRI